MSRFGGFHFGRKSHKQWEKEREKEWKESQKGHGKDDKHGDHGE